MQVITTQSAAGSKENDADKLVKAVESLTSNLVSLSSIRPCDKELFKQASSAFRSHSQSPRRKNAVAEESLSAFPFLPAYVSAMIGALNTFSWYQWIPADQSLIGMIIGDFANKKKTLSYVLDHLSLLEDLCKRCIISSQLMCMINERCIEKRQLSFSFGLAGLLKGAQADRVLIPALFKTYLALNHFDSKFSLQSLDACELIDKKTITILQQYMKKQHGAVVLTQLEIKALRKQFGQKTGALHHVLADIAKLSDPFSREWLSEIGLDTRVFASEQQVTPSAADLSS